MVGCFRAQHLQKSRKCHGLPRKWFHFKPLTPPPGKGSFREHREGGKEEEGRRKRAGRWEEEGGRNLGGRRERGGEGGLR